MTLGMWLTKAESHWAPEQTISFSLFYLGEKQLGLLGLGHSRGRLGAAFLLLTNQPCGPGMDVWGRWHDDCLCWLPLGMWSSGSCVTCSSFPILHHVSLLLWDRALLGPVVCPVAWVGGTLMCVLIPTKVPAKQATFEAGILDDRTTAPSFFGTLIVVGDTLYSSQDPQIICQ